MKRIFLVSSLVLAFFIVGCSDKANVEPSQDSTTTSDQTTSDSSNASGNSTIDGNATDRDIDSTNANRGNVNLESIYFKFDKFDIDNENISVVRANAEEISKNQYIEVRVEGNTDEWGSDEYNFALALKRASSTRDALISNGIPAGAIKLLSYGESKPVCLDKTKECWQKNRRVDFVLVK